jgi:foldase protein PrsA
MVSALGAFFVVAALVAGCGGSSLPSDSVATMAGNPITKQAFDHWMYVAEKGNASEDGSSTVIVPNDPPEFTNCIKQAREEIPTLKTESTKTIRTDCSTLFTSLSSQVMNYLIESYWYQADAYKEGIRITPKQLAADFAKAKKQQFTSPTQYTEFLKETGQTAADILFRVRVNALYSDLISRLQKKITPAAIQAYYTAHSTEFGTPEKRNIRIVRTANSSAGEAQAKAALSALKSGQSWDAVAKKYSADTTTKNNGGLLSGITSGEEEAALNKVAFSAPLNTLEGPVHGTFGWYVVEVVKITAGTKATLAKETTLIKELLTSQSQTAAEKAINTVSKKNWGARTTCRQYYATSDCANYKKPKTTTTSTTSGSATSTVSTGADTGTVSTGAATTGAATTGASSTATSTSSTTSSGTTSTIDTQ